MRASLYSMVLNSKIGLEIMVITSRFTTKGEEKWRISIFHALSYRMLTFPSFLVKFLIELIIRAATFSFSSLELRESVENEEMCVTYVEF